MNAIIACPTCGARLPFGPDVVGQVVRCPGCCGEVRVSGLPGPPVGPPMIDEPAPPPVQAVPRVATSAGRAAPISKPRQPAKRKELSIEVLGIWGITGILLIVAGILIWRLKVTHEAELAASAAKAQVAKSPPEAEEKPTRGDKSDVPQEDRVTIAPVEPPIETPTESKAKAADDSPDDKSPGGKRDVLGDVPLAWRLPTLVSSAPEKVASLAREPHEPISMSVISTAARLAPKAAIVAAAESDGRSWNIDYVSRADSAERVALATVRREGLDLTFAWTAPLADPPIRRQLSNCQIEVKHGESVRIVQLREPLVKEVVVLDLNQAEQLVEFDLTDLPPVDRLRLEISELNGFHGGATIRGEERSLAIGKGAVIEFADVAGAEMLLSLELSSTSGTLALRLRPTFREGRVTYELTHDELERTKKALNAALAVSIRDAAPAKAQLQAAKFALSRLNTSRPSENNALFGAWQAEFVQAKLRAEMAATVVATLDQQNQECKQRLEAVPKIRALLDSLHQSAKIHYVVCAESGEQDLVLVDGRGSDSKQTTGDAEK